MTIAEVERVTGLARANIRFYEKEGLLSPARSENGYRDYSKEDVETLKKIRLLRALRLPVPTICAVQAGDMALPDAIRAQADVLRQDLRESEQALEVCRALCADAPDWDGLDAEKYLSQPFVPVHQRGESAAESDRDQPAGCPWRRYFARALDMALYGIVIYAVQHLLLRSSAGGGFAMLLQGYAGIGLMLLIEPVLLHLWGTTVGKKIWGFKVRDALGNKLSLPAAFGRTFGVFCKGMGYNIPLYSLYREYCCYRDCTRAELPWDVEYDCAIVPANRAVHPGRVIAWMAAYLWAIAATAGILLLAELPPHHGELTLE